MTVKRMDNVGIVVENLEAAIGFFTELGLELEGRAPSKETGQVALPGQLEPPVVADHRKAPVNALGYLRVMFTVEDIDDTLARLGTRGAELVGDVVRYQDTYRLCYIRGPEGILIGLAQELSQPRAAR